MLVTNTQWQGSVIYLCSSQSTRSINMSRLCTSPFLVKSFDLPHLQATAHSTVQRPGSACSSRICTFLLNLTQQTKTRQNNNMEDKREVAQAATEHVDSSKVSTFLDVVPFEIREQILAPPCYGKRHRHNRLQLQNCATPRSSSILQAIPSRSW